MENNRIELHLHTNKTKLNGVTTIDNYINKALELNMKALGITDYNSVESLVEVSKIPKNKLQDLKIIYGAEIRVNSEEEFHVLVLVKEDIGLKNLYKLVSLSNDKKLTKPILEKYRKGLLIGSPSINGEVSISILNNLSNIEIEEKTLFYDYLEIQPYNNEKKYKVVNGKVVQTINEELNKTINQKIVKLGIELEKLVIASSSTHYITEVEKKSYELLMYSSDSIDVYQSSGKLHFNTTKEMLEEFNYLEKEKTYEVVITNPSKIVNMCRNINIDNNEYKPLLIKNCNDLTSLVNEKINNLYKDRLDIKTKQRIEDELNIIKEEKLETIYIGIYKIINEFKNTSNIVSVDGFFTTSFIAYLLGMTDINPLSDKYNIFKSEIDEFKNQIKKKEVIINCSKDKNEKIKEITKEVFKDNNIYNLSTTSNIEPKDIKKYISNRNENYVSEEIEFDEVYENMMKIKKGSYILNNTFIVASKNSDINNYTTTEIINDVECINLDFDFISNSVFKISIKNKDNITFLEKLIKETNLKINDIDIEDNIVLSLFNTNFINSEIKQNIKRLVITSGIINFESKFMLNLMLDLEISSLNELVKLQNISKGSSTWLGNAEDLVKKHNRTINEIITSTFDIVKYLTYIGLDIDKSYAIANFISNRKKGYDEQQWQKYIDVMNTYKVPDYFIESCSKIEYLVDKNSSINDCIYALMLGWFKIYYPLEFHSIYFTNFDYTSNKNWVNLTLEELNCEIEFNSKKNIYVEQLMFEMYRRGIEFLEIDKEKSDLLKFKIEDSNIRIPLKYLEFDIEDICSNEKNIDNMNTIMKQIYDLKK